MPATSIHLLSELLDAKHILPRDQRARASRNGAKYCTAAPVAY
jgi:hypothetical protein